MEKATSSEARLVEVMLNGKNIFRDRSLREHGAMGSKGGRVRALRTKGMSQEGALAMGAGLRSDTPLRNLLSWGWDERYPHLG